MNDLQKSASLGLLSHWSALPHQEGAGIVTTLDITRPAVAVELQNILCGETESLWDMSPDDLLAITDFTATFGRGINDETGEEWAGPIVTLSGPDGAWHTKSEYAFRALQLIGYLRGPPPWNPPLVVSPARCRSRNKRQYQSILLRDV